MRVTYTGRDLDLAPAQTKNLQLEFEKVGKLLDNGRGEAHAHVVLSHERHLHHAEVTVPYHNHDLIGQASDTDLFAAIHAAVGKLESQAIKAKAKWRDGQRGPKIEAEPAA
jgi:putative sigma-54 modulation protein